MSKSGLLVVIIIVLPLSQLVGLTSPSMGNRSRTVTMSVPSLASLVSPAPNIFARIDGIREPPGSSISAPDPQVAAGPNHVVEMANNMVEVFSKEGTSLQNSTFI